jgi:hypothetical protein
VGAPSFFFPAEGRPFDEIVDAYLAQLRAQARGDEAWATFHVSNLYFTEDRYEEAWSIITAAIERADGERQLSRLGAGDLESLLTIAGPQFAERVDELARRSPQFRTALAAVWSTCPEIDEVRARLAADLD